MVFTARPVTLFTVLRVTYWYSQPIGVWRRSNRKYAGRQRAGTCGQPRERGSSSGARPRSQKEAKKRHGTTPSSKTKHQPGKIVKLGSWH